jgi:hypothetical protein
MPEFLMGQKMCLLSHVRIDSGRDKVESTKLANYDDQQSAKVSSHKKLQCINAHHVSGMLQLKPVMARNYYDYN